ncbi:MAG: hypothetical protein A2W29_05725 [Gemmatimonadetes bacterium RBG_16_66_8]|nr:MAG: hypothetical protein A2W29_05725 [Gemmatimonadetes bacterium RBG_16_66_8]
MTGAVVVLSAVVGLASPPWGQAGHHIVCEIAWRRLSPRAQAMVADLRRQDPDARDSFASDCLWADAARSTTHRFTYNYHFVNIPSKASGIDANRDCGDPERRCAPWAIRHYALILQDPAMRPIQRAEALKFLTHFVGDLHQPLHVGRPQDRGGNGVRVSFFGRRVIGRDTLNLHSVWDTHILARADLVVPGAALVLNDEITETEASQWSATPLSGWVAESYELDETLVYELPPGNEIGEEYFRAASSASKVQLKRAGVRLAALLNAIADGKLDPALLDF